MNNLFMILKDSMILSFVFRDHQRLRSNSASACSFLRFNANFKSSTNFHSRKETPSSIVKSGRFAH